MDVPAGFFNGKNFHSAKSTGDAHPADTPIIAQRFLRQLIPRFEQLKRLTRSKIGQR
jgi:hypothetical protein